MLNEQTGEPVGQAQSEQARIAALGIILDRAYGKAAQPLTGDDGDGEPEFKITHIKLVGVRWDPDKQAWDHGDGHDDTEQSDASSPRGQA